MNEQEKGWILGLAREAVELAVHGKRPPPVPDEPVLNTEAGAFVTLKKNGHLRGCIGHFTGLGTLGATVRSMAREAALGDPRFVPVSPDELADLTIEVSVLSPMSRIHPDDVKPGVHGLFIRRGRYHGTLLPQVAIEEAWDRKTFLAHTCMKAGLSADAWLDPETEILAYTAEVFGETQQNKEKE